MQQAINYTTQIMYFVRCATYTSVVLVDDGVVMTIIYGYMSKTNLVHMYAIINNRTYPW